MGEWIISEFGSFFLSKSLSHLERIRIKWRLRKTKIQLKVQIESNLLGVYGNECYYHEFDTFLERKHFVSRLLSDLYSTSMVEYKSVDYYTRILVEEFIQIYPQYVIYRSTLTQIIFLIFKTVFDALNECNDESARIIVNNIKEISGELEGHIKDISEQNRNLHEDHKKIYEILLDMRNSGTTDLFSIDNESVQTGLKVYKASLQSYFWGKQGYIDRLVENENGKTVIDALLEYKKIVLLGEPGCGKTTETQKVLEEVCENISFDDVIPVYISLAEYGLLFESIREGIQRKLDMYVPKISMTLVNQLLNSSKVLLILDGADEIVSVEKRNKFFFDINEVMALPNIMVMLTSRRNQYHGNAKNVKEVSISGIERHVIDKKLREAGINWRVTEEFYELFQYPLFLEIGISVLNENAGRVYNKSQLIEKYISLLFYNRDREKGIVLESEKNLHKAIEPISEFAFYNFSQPSFSFWEFDKLFCETDFSHANICDLFRLDVFSINMDVKFSHKQYKEYFAAFHLVNHISVIDEIEKYRELMLNEEWQEVLVLACGMFNNIEEQNLFLDELLTKNFRTYIRCVKMKNDLSPKLQTYSHEDYSRYYLEILYRSYMSIVNTYFPVLKAKFAPQIGVKPELLAGKKTCIVGEFSQDKKHLSYWFDWCDTELPDVQLLEGKGRDAYKDLENRSMIERRSISIYHLNLEKCGYERDSARMVAVERIKEDIIKILKTRNLLEDDAILCERLTEIKSNIKFIKTSSSIEEMYLAVKTYVDDITKEYANKEVELAGISYGKVDMLELLDLLQILHLHQSEYDMLTLPERDEAPNGDWIWKYYSEDQIIKLLKSFFYQVVASYQEIVECNFPLMKTYFNMSKDYPLKYRIQVKFKDTQDLQSEPSIAYYYVSTTKDDLEPEVIKVDELSFGMPDEVIAEIKESFISNGKEVKQLTITNTGITMCINRRYGGFNNSPLAAFVYGKLKEEFENLFD